MDTYLFDSGFHVWLDFLWNIKKVCSKNEKKRVFEWGCFFFLVNLIRFEGFDEFSVKPQQLKKQCVWKSSVKCDHAQKISSNELFSNFFSESVHLTKKFLIFQQNSWSRFSTLWKRICNPFIIMNACIFSREIIDTTIYVEFCLTYFPSMQKSKSCMICCCWLFSREINNCLLNLNWIWLDEFSVKVEIKDAMKELFFSWNWLKILKNAVFCLTIFFVKLFFCNMENGMDEFLRKKKNLLTENVVSFDLTKFSVKKDILKTFCSPTQ